MKKITNLILVVVLAITSLFAVSGFTLIPDTQVQPNQITYVAGDPIYFTATTAKLNNPKVTISCSNGNAFEFTNLTAVRNPDRTITYTTETKTTPDVGGGTCSGWLYNYQAKYKSYSGIGSSPNFYMP
jgi:hypothetical protein